VKWLRGQHATPKGRVRETSPFGYREQDVIKQEDVTIEWTGMTDRNYDGRTYIPQFKVYSAAEDGGFLYLLNQGKVDLVG
jgi:predicted RNA-binding protein with PUA-like domain